MSYVNHFYPCSVLCIRYLCHLSSQKLSIVLVIYLVGRGNFGRMRVTLNEGILTIVSIANVSNHDM